MIELMAAVGLLAVVLVSFLIASRNGLRQGQKTRGLYHAAFAAGGAVAEIELFGVAIQSGDATAFTAYSQNLDIPDLGTMRLVIVNAHLSDAPVDTELDAASAVFSVYTLLPDIQETF